MVLAVEKLLTWRPGRYARDSLVTFGWLIARAATQVVLTLALARLLGAQGYGLFITALALAGFFVPLASMGLGAVLVRDGARDPAVLPEYLGRALSLWIFGTLIASLLATAILMFALPVAIALPVVLLFAFSEISVGSLVELVARTEQAQQRMHACGKVQLGLLLVRLVILAVFASLLRSVEGWLLSYAGANLIYLVGVVAKLIGAYRPGWCGRIDLRLLRAGFPFAVGALSFRLQTEFNKPLLAQVSLSGAGNFNVAQRVVDLLQLPLNALLESLWPRLYAAQRYQQRLFLTGGAVVGVALAGGLVLVAAAPLLPLLLGADYASTAELIRVLAWLPVVQTTRNLLAYPLTLAGRAHRLVGIYGVGTSLGMAVTGYLVTHFGLTGALVAAYAFEGVLILMIMWAYLHAGREK